MVTSQFIFSVGEQKYVNEFRIRADDPYIRSLIIFPANTHRIKKKIVRVSKTVLFTLNAKNRYLTKFRNLVCAANVLNVLDSNLVLNIHDFHTFIALSVSEFVTPCRYK